MYKFIIKKRESDECIYILHAFPDVDNREAFNNTAYRWMLTPSISLQGRELLGENFESLTFNSKKVKELNWEGKFVYCKFKTPSGKQGKTDYVKIYFSFKDSIKNNNFDEIDTFDKNGMIVPLR
jgi:hypothetical protein